MFYTGYRGDADKVEELVKLKADLHATDALGNSPLHLAAFNGHTKVIRSKKRQFYFCVGFVRQMGARWQKGLVGYNSRGPALAILQILEFRLLFTLSLPVVDFRDIETERAKKLLDMLPRVGIFHSLSVAFVAME